MKKILFLGSNKGVFQMVSEANKLGYYTIVTDYLEPEKSNAKQIASEYWMLSTADIDELELKCKENSIGGIACGISGFNINSALELTKRLNLPFYCTRETRQKSLVKSDFKAMCKNAKVPVAKDFFVSYPPTELELSAIEFPVMVKAVDQGSNRGMSYCYKKEDILPAINYAHTFSKNEKFIIERMLHGVEYTAYYALANGDASLVCLYTDLSQPGTPNSCYAINTTACDKLDLYLKEVDPYFRDMLKNEGMKEGICWIELILDEDGHFYALDMGYRMTGDMMAIPIMDVYGFNSYRWMIEIAAGIKHKKEDLPLLKGNKPAKCGCSYILWSNNKPGTVAEIVGLEDILKDENIILTTDVKIGSKYKAYQYLLTFSFTCDDVETVCQTIEKINHVKVLNTEGVDVSIHFTDFDRLRKIYYSN